VRGVSASSTADALPRPGDLPLLPRAAYHASVVSDYALRTGLASAIAAASLPSAIGPVAKVERRRLSFYAELAASRDADFVFVPPQGAAAVDVREGRPNGLPADGRIELLRFPSTYVARNPELRRSYARHVRNATARAQHWRHADGPRPTLLVIHGFGASPAWFNSAFFSLPRFFAEGWDVLLFTLPFHGSRRDPRAVNGLGLFAQGMAGFSEALLHAIHDLRVVLERLRGQGVPRIGVTGLSLGGYTSALLASVDRDLDFVIPNAAVTWLPPMLRAWFPASTALRAARALSGIPQDALEQALAVHSSLNYACRVPHDRRLIVAGLGDRLAPPEQSLLLWEHWGRPRLEWFAGSHVIHLGRQAYLDAMRELVQRPRSDGDR
jgi:pimeloyl-ACP methyl ester carboxylesterase